MNMERFFALLICLYPRHFRETFGGELQTVFADALKTARTRGRWAVLVLCARELRDLPLALLREYDQEKGLLMQRYLAGFTVLWRWALLLVIPAMVASLCNYAQWHYWFQPPPLKPLVQDFATVDSLSYFEFVQDDTTQGYHASNGDAAQGHYSGFADTDMARVPRWARSQDRAELTPLNATRLAALPQHIDTAGWTIDFLSGANGVYYPGPRGYAVQGQDENGQPLLLISMVRVIADDHYGYYEGLFRPSGDRFSLVASNAYRFDSAGVEFAQWPFWFLGALLLWLPATAVILMLRRRLLDEKKEPRRVINAKV